MAASYFKRDQRHLPRPADHGIPFTAEYIDFRAYPKSVEVKAGLDREARAGQNSPVVVRFVIVQMDAVSMHCFAEAMPRAVKNLGAIPGLFEHVPRRPVDLPPVQLSSGHGRLFNQRQGRVACANDRIEGASGLV